VTLRAPYPYFGGKSRAAHLIWDRFGDVANYVEPFAGSLAVLLARPTEPRIETVNDLDCHIANFWRAVQADPDAVAKWCDWPVNEADLHARHLWLVQGLPAHREKMLTDPDYFDAKIAGWWVWGICQWIGSGWCAERKPPIQIPHVGDAGRGVHRKRPHVGDAGMGVHRKLPHVGDAGRGGLFDALQARLRSVRVCCGDWSRVCGPTPTFHNGLTGVLLDPPYADTADRDASLYREDSLSVAHDVRKWAIENGDNPLMRIALCGYEGEHDMPPSWECVAWKANGGYGGQSKDHDNPNAKRERIWFSPHCLGATQRSLF
jgi:DNA adenine methylase